MINKVMPIFGKRAVPSETLLLDLYPNAALAYSFRYLRTAYIGSPVVRVRRSSDDLQADFTAAELTDGTLTTWVGVGNNGLITIWYDQTINPQNLTQSTLTAQPLIVVNGLLNTYASKPSILINGNQFLVAPVSTRTSLSFAHNSSASVSYVSNLTNGIWFGTSSAAFGNDNATGFEIGFSTQNAELAIRNNNVKRVADNIDNTEFFSGGIYYSQWDVLNNDVNLRSANFKNNTSLTQTKLGSSTSPVSTFASGARLAFFGKFFGTANPSGDFSEMVLWEGLQTFNREGISTEANDYYTIY